MAQSKKERVGIVSEFGMNWVYVNKQYSMIWPRVTGRPCWSCYKKTRNNDFYMVHNHIWRKYGNGKGVLCLDCLQKRIGRSLKEDDFKIRKVL